MVGVKADGVLSLARNRTAGRLRQVSADFLQVGILGCVLESCWERESSVGDLLVARVVRSLVTWHLCILNKFKGIYIVCSSFVPLIHKVFLRPRLNNQNLRRPHEPTQRLQRQ